MFGARQQAYDVFVKRKLAKANGSYQGRGYVKANDRPLSEGAATNQLMTILDKYANRSGYIKKAKEQLAVMPESLKTELLAKFRRAKRNPNILVEKTKYAIDSYEEKKAIPYEGQRIRKAKGFISSKRRGKNLKWL
jgi:CRISPR/Cas system CSM-associated protein Csm3 (group 7 of RAMP superfamily)